MINTQKSEEIKQKMREATEKFEKELHELLEKHKIATCLFMGLNEEKYEALDCPDAKGEKNHMHTKFGLLNVMNGKKVELEAIAAMLLLKSDEFRDLMFEAGVIASETNSVSEIIHALAHYRKEEHKHTAHC